MDALQLLIEKIGNDDGRQLKATTKLFDQLGSEMNKTITIDVPVRFAPLFDLFELGKEKLEEAFQNKSGPDIFTKGKISLKDFLNELKKGGETKSVKVNLSKVKNAITEGLKEKADKSESSMNESLGPVSLLTEVVDPIDAFVTGYIVFIIGLVIFGLACSIYIFVITIWALKEGEITLGEEKDVGRFGMILYHDNPLIWAITMHVKLSKKKDKKSGKKDAKNESIENPEQMTEDSYDDSILGMMESEEPKEPPAALESKDKDESAKQAPDDSAIASAYNVVLNHMKASGIVPNVDSSGTNKTGDAKDDMRLRVSTPSGLPDDPMKEVQHEENKETTDLNYDMELDTEGVDGSILDMVESTGEEALTGTSENDQMLLNAYRTVLRDLGHRAPGGGVPDPLQEGALGDVVAKAGVTANVIKDKVKDKTSEVVKNTVAEIKGATASVRDKIKK